MDTVSILLNHNSEVVPIKLGDNIISSGNDARALINITDPSRHEYIGRNDIYFIAILSIDSTFKIFIFKKRSCR